MAAVFLALLAGSAVATYGLIQARGERDNAETQAASLLAVNRFLSDLLSAVQPNEAQGREVTVREVLDEAGTKIGEQFADQPLVEAAIRETLGRTYQAMGHLDESLAHHREALRLRRLHLGTEHVDALRSVRLVAEVLEDPLEQETFSKQAVELCRRVLGEDHPETLESLGALSYAYWRQGRRAEGYAIELDLLPRLRRVLGEHHRSTLTTMGNLAVSLDELGRAEEAEALYREHLALARRVLGDKHITTLLAMSNLGYFYERRARFTEAEELLVEAYQTMGAVLGPVHPDTFGVGNTLSQLYRDWDRVDSAITLDRERLAARRQRSGERHVKTAHVLHHLAEELRVRGHLEEAEVLARQALLVYREAPRSGPGVSPEVSARAAERAHAEAVLARILEERGQTEAAEELFRAAVEITRADLGAEHIATLHFVEVLACFEQRRSQHDRSEELCRDVLVGCGEMRGDQEQVREDR